MATPDPEAGGLQTIHFEMRYITADFDFGGAQISVSDPARRMDFLLRKRIPEDAPPSAFRDWRWIRRRHLRKRDDGKDLSRGSFLRPAFHKEGSR
jgi:hypothetical protein